MNILETFNPLLSSALERYQRFNNPEARDLHKIFGPALATIANVAGVDQSRATKLIDSWDPASVTADTLRAAVAELTKPTIDVEAIRLKQAALDAEIVGDLAKHPPTARDIVLQERKKPLRERSLDSIMRELFEIRTGKIRRDTADPNGGWGGERLPAVVWDVIAADGREATLQGEIDRRDLATHGLEYQAPVKTARASGADMSYLRPMRG